MSPYPPPDEVDTPAEQRAFYREVDDWHADRATHRHDIESEGDW